MSTIDPRVNERLHIDPIRRLEVFAYTSGTLGLLSGFYLGTKLASLRYLTENSHRLPKNVGGWYFYHKKKNYVMLLDGGKSAFKSGLKYSLNITGFFGLEALIDNIRGEIDFLNTLTATVLYGGVYGYFNSLSKIQIKNYLKKGVAVGLTLGITQDILRYTRGADIWYLQRLGINTPPLSNQPLA